MCRSRSDEAASPSAALASRLGGTARETAAGAGSAGLRRRCLEGALQHIMPSHSPSGGQPCAATPLCAHWQCYCDAAAVCSLRRVQPSMLPQAGMQKPYWQPTRFLPRRGPLVVGPCRPWWWHGAMLAVLDDPLDHRHPSLNRVNHDHRPRIPAQKWVFESMRNRAPGYFAFQVLCSLYWKIVPF